MQLEVHRGRPSRRAREPPRTDSPAHPRVRLRLASHPRAEACAARPWRPRPHRRSKRAAGRRQARRSPTARHARAQAERPLPFPVQQPRACLPAGRTRLSQQQREQSVAAPRLARRGSVPRRGAVPAPGSPRRVRTSASTTSASVRGNVRRTFLRVRVRPRWRRSSIHRDRAGGVRGGRGRTGGRARDRCSVPPNRAASSISEQRQCEGSGS